MDEFSNERLATLLLQNQKLLQENNALLHRMRRDTLLSRLFRLGLLVLWIIVSWYVYKVYIEPNIAVLQSNQGFFEQIKDTTEAVRSLYGGQDYTAQ